MRILVIDDEPCRALPLLKSGHDVRIVLGRKQTLFALQDGLKYWVPEHIMLDHDMPGDNGLAIAKLFCTDLVDFPVCIWSFNPVGAQQILDVLKAEAQRQQVECQAYCRRFDTDPTWYDYLLENK